ncbi:MAG: hypothetical protein ACI3XI_06660 [Eubacteriales bacterium]
MKRPLSLLLALILALLHLSSCAGTTADAVLVLNFGERISIDDLSRSQTTTVTIVGFMSTEMPQSGSHFYLMNMPRQSTPYNIPNTSNLMNTVAVCAKDGEAFKYTDCAVRVTGTLEFGSFVDSLGYEYNYRIKDAVAEIPDDGDLTDELRLWQLLAKSNIISEIYRIYNYVSFLCFWPTYTAPFQDKNDYLYPDDAVYFFKTVGADYHYGYAENYFSDIAATVRGIGSERLEALLENIETLNSLAEDAIAELEAGNYTVCEEYTNAFGDGRSQYKMNKVDEYEAAIDAAYREFAEWLASWEI